MSIKFDIECDYYALLEVDNQATSKDIEKAFKRLALIWHPDKNKKSEATGQFQEIRFAYELLRSVPDKREYDHERAQRHFGWARGFKPETWRAPPPKQRKQAGPGTSRFDEHGIPVGEDPSFDSDAASAKLEARYTVQICFAEKQRGPMPKDIHKNP